MEGSKPDVEELQRVKDEREDNKLLSSRELKTATVTKGMQILTKLACPSN